MEYKLRKLKEDDIKDIMRLDKRFRIKWTDKSYLKKIKSYPHLTRGAFTLEGKMIGFIVAEPKNNNIVISRIAVGKRYEGKGIGSELLSRIIRENPGKTFQSHVASDNIKSVMLHINHRFKIVQKHKYKSGIVGYTLKRYPINIGGYY